MLRLLLPAFLFTLACAASLRAGDDAQKKAQPEFPPSPKVAPEFPPAPKAIPGPAVVMPYQRTDTREVWQYYAPNRMGRMVPRIIVTPYGALNSRTLEPFPWAGTRPTEVLPIVVD
jgi:hypothetical protein